jgi:Protein of unknown function (DUF2750)
MTVSAARAAAFFAEVVAAGAVWSVADINGHPAPVNEDGRRSMPFWSKESRVLSVVDRVDAYRSFDVVRIDLDVWVQRWLPGLVGDGLLVGLNWSGDSATGYDVEPSDVAARLAIERG